MCMIVEGEEAKAFRWEELAGFQQARRREGTQKRTSRGLGTGKHWTYSGD